MNRVRVTSRENPRSVPVGTEFDTDQATARRWVGRGWGTIVGESPDPAPAQVSDVPDEIAGADRPTYVEREPLETTRHRRTRAAS